LEEENLFQSVNLANFTNGKIIFGNSQYATPNALKKRDEYEMKMITLLEMGVVESWEHFKSFWDRLN